MSIYIQAEQHMFCDRHGIELPPCMLPSDATHYASALIEDSRKTKDIVDWCWWARMHVILKTARQTPWYFTFVNGWEVDPGRWDTRREIGAVYAVINPDKTSMLPIAWNIDEGFEPGTGRIEYVGQTLVWFDRIKQHWQQRGNGCLSKALYENLPYSLAWEVLMWRIVGRGVDLNATEKTFKQILQPRIMA